MFIHRKTEKREGRGRTCDTRTPEKERDRSPMVSSTESGRVMRSKLSVDISLSQFGFLNELTTKDDYSHHHHYSYYNPYYYYDLLFPVPKLPSHHKNDQNFKDV